MQRKFHSKSQSLEDIFKYAAEQILKADVLYLTSGAGMSVDCGLPDFRSDQSIITKFLSRQKQLTYREVINPLYFESNPHKFWYIYGDRFNKYREAQPHIGYYQQLEICQKLKKDQYFVYTSNVDDMYTKAGFPQGKIFELHGNIFKLQCFDCQLIYNAPENLNFELDHENFESKTLPCCPKCNKLTRPNILLWNDSTFVWERQFAQKDKFNQFVWNCLFQDKRILVLEVGAGTEYQAMRVEGEQLAQRFGSELGASVIRINPAKGIPSIFAEKNVNFIEESSFKEVIKDKQKKKDALDIVQNYILFQYSIS